jgi:hypothetical protein
MHHLIAGCSRKKDDKKDGGSKHIHPDRVQIGHPAPEHVFFGQKPRFSYQVFDRTKEFTVKMGDIIEKMLYQVPDSLLGLQVLLAADMAIPAVQFGLAVEADLFFSFL